MEMLESAFDGALHAVEQIQEAIHWDASDRRSAAHHAAYLEDALKLFRSGLSERGLEEFYERDIALVEFPVAEIGKYLSGETSAIPNVKGAYIYAHFLNEKVRALQRMAHEIDAENAA